MGNLTSKEFFNGISFQNFHSFTKEPLSLSSSWKEIISVMSSVDRPLSSIKVKCRKNFNCVKVRYRLEANQLSLQREMSKVTFSWNNTGTKFIWLFGLESQMWAQYISFVLMIRAKIPNSMSLFKVKKINHNC